MCVMKKILLIVNPRAGKCKAAKRLSEILHIFQRGGYASTVLITEKAGDAKQYVNENIDDSSFVVCIGGDGTFSEVVSSMVCGGYQKPIGYIPAGSTNDVATSLGLSFDLCCAAYDILNGTPKEYDVGCFNGRSFAYVAAFGLFARTSYGTPQELKNAFGRLAYVLDGMRDLQTIHSQHVRIEIDEEHIEGDFLLGMISNSTSIGGILRFKTDDVSLNDGYLELMLISRPTTPWELSQMIQALVNQSYSECSNIVFRRGKRICIQTDTSIDWSLDGEYVRGDEMITIENYSNAIKVIIPSLTE